MQQISATGRMYAPNRTTYIHHPPVELDARRRIRVMLHRSAHPLRGKCAPAAPAVHIAVLDVFTHVCITWNVLLHTEDQVVLWHCVQNSGDPRSRTRHSSRVKCGFRRGSSSRRRRALIDVQMIRRQRVQHSGDPGSRWRGRYLISDLRQKPLHEGLVHHLSTPSSSPDQYHGALFNTLAVSQIDLLLVLCKHR